MIVKQSKKLLLFLVFALQVSGVMSAAAPVVEEPGFFRALGSDALSLAKGIGYCIGGVAKGLASTYLLARKYPGQAVAVAVGVPLLMGWVYAKGYEKNIKPIADRAQAPDRRYTQWAKGLWKNAGALMRDQNQVLNTFKADFGVPNNQTITDLQQEINAIFTDMQSLEADYLVCKAPLDIALYNIRKEFEAACEKYAPGIGEEKLNLDQLLNVNKELEKVIDAKILPYALFSINYGQAARLWCSLKSNWLRLRKILHLIRPTTTGDSNIPSINRSQNVHDQQTSFAGSITHL